MGRKNLASGAFRLRVGDRMFAGLPELVLRLVCEYLRNPALAHLARTSLLLDSLCRPTIAFRAILRRARDAQRLADSGFTDSEAEQSVDQPSSGPNNYHGFGRWD